MTVFDSAKDAIVKLDLPRSTPVERNIRTFETLFNTDSGHTHKLQVELRWDDQCGNGVNTFSICTTEYVQVPTGYGPPQWRYVRSGRDEELLAKHFPELKPALDFHLVSANGPHHYLANTVYLAGNRDYNGFRADDQRRAEDGKLMWRCAQTREVVFSEDKPAARSVAFGPVMGNGKQSEPERVKEILQAEGLTDLTVERLKNCSLADIHRLVGLRVKHPDIVSRNIYYLLGERDYFGYLKGEQRRAPRSEQGALMWALKEAPFTVVASETQPADVVLDWEPVMGEGKARELNAARQTAVWPDATDEELSQEPEELRKALLDRLPSLMARFKDALESIGFDYDPVGATKAK